MSTRSGATAEGVICRRATKDLETWRRDPILYQPHNPASHGPGTQEASRGCAAVESPLVHQPGLCHLKARLGLGDPLPQWLTHVAGGSFPAAGHPAFWGGLLVGWGCGRLAGYVRGCCRSQGASVRIRKGGWPPWADAAVPRATGLGAGWGLGVGLLRGRPGPDRGFGSAGYSCPRSLSPGFPCESPSVRRKLGGGARTQSWSRICCPTSIFLF